MPCTDRWARPLGLAWGVVTGEGLVTGCPAPAGMLAHLSRPGKFTEIVRFDEPRRFKPRSLDF